MSDEQFLSRWSRRKREATDDAAADQAAPAPAPERDDDAPTPDTARQSEAVPAAPAAATPRDVPAPGDAPVFDPARLPPIESITAETDIRPFLAAGVPPDVTHAALRRAWSADPAIRDFVGLAEYAWDFTKPDAMRGFGPLEMTDTLRRYAAQILGTRERDSAPVAQVSGPPSGSAAEEGAQAGTQADRPVGDRQNSAGATTEGSENVTAAGNDAAPQQEPADLPPIAKRNHGGALPQ
jgi:hypothetical protein